MLNQTIATISIKSQKAIEHANQLMQVAIAAEEVNNAYLLAIAEHIGNLKALTQELEYEVLKETSERRIQSAEVAERLHISISTLFKRWKEIKSQQ